MVKAKLPNGMKLSHCKTVVALVLDLFNDVLYVIHCPVVG
jgi:hypothetical protein